MNTQPERRVELNKPFGLQVERCNGGEPILSPTTNWWESGVTFNAAAIFLDIRNFGLDIRIPQ
ncbi:MAG: hypothetical protein IH586_01390 [Anaerolineaceae bacterium]|nr:hypothetical protein [Anaerolineaceae bacterium]